MVDSTYSKLTATTSRTNLERRTAKLIAKDLAKNGHTDIQQPPKQPRREGLRGHRFAYSHDEPPRRVVRRDPVATQLKPIPIPRLEGQEDIPGSDEEPEATDPSTAVLLRSQFPTQETQNEVDDDSRSQTSTVIEEDLHNSDAEGSIEGGEGMQNADFGKDHDARGAPLGWSSGKGIAESTREIAPPARATGELDTQYNNPHVTVPANPPADHPFGPSTQPSVNLLGDTSSEDLQLLIAAFPTDSLSEAAFFNTAPSHSSREQYSVAQYEMGFAAPFRPDFVLATFHHTGNQDTTALNFPAPSGFSVPFASPFTSVFPQPNEMLAPEPPRSHPGPATQNQFSMDSDPEIVGPGTHVPLTSELDAADPYFQHSGDIELERGAQVTMAEADDPHAGQLGLCLDAPNYFTSTPTRSGTPRQPQSPTHSRERPQTAILGGTLLANQSRALNGTSASPRISLSETPVTSRLMTPRMTTPAASATLSMPRPRPTCRADPFSPTPRAMAADPSSTPSTPAVRRHPLLAPQTVRATSLRNSPRSPQPQLPSTPRAISSRPLSRSISTPGRPRPVVYSTPSRSSAPLFLFADASTGSESAPGSRVGTPSPLLHAPNTSAQALNNRNPFLAPAGSASVSHNAPPLTAVGSMPSPPPDAFLHPVGDSSDTLLITPLGVETGSTPSTPNGPVPNEPALGSWGAAMETPRLHRVRSPPPLARQYNRVVISDEDLESDSDGFIARASEQRNDTLRVELIPTRTTKAPTVAEFVVAKAREIRQIQQSRKSNERLNADPLSSGDRMGSFEKTHQGFMKVMRAHFLWDYVTRSPWSEDGVALIDHAKSFASTATGMSGDTICTDTFNTTALKAGPQLRGLAHVPVQRVVKDYYQLSDGDSETISQLLARDRYLFPDNEMHADDMFNVEIVGRVLAVIFFGTSKRIGIIFMDRLLLDDKQADLDALFSLIALPALGGTSVPPTIVDKSPSAKRGIPIPAIAYACIQINHALERIRCPNKKKLEFQEQTYGFLWADYVRKLAKHRQLGALRASFLDAVQKEFCRVWVRRAAPQGDDHLW